jgi:hypothetical protein
VSSSFPRAGWKAAHLAPFVPFLSHLESSVDAEVADDYCAGDDDRDRTLAQTRIEPRVMSVEDGSFKVALARSAADLRPQLSRWAALARSYRW